MDGKKEERNFYAIDASDLLRVEGCALCGSNSITGLTEVYLAGRLNFFSTSVCNDCLYTFRSISPSHQWFRKCWAKISTKRLEVFNPEVEELRKERYGRYRHLLARYVQKARVLDVGAGYGSGSKVFYDHGYEVEALEAEDDKANYVEKCLNLPVHATSLEEFFEKKNNYGLIIFAHCLEHLDNPALVMSNIQNLLDPESGVLYVEVPLLWSIVTWSDALYLTHKSNFTERTIVSLAVKNGFEILEKVYYQHAVDEAWDLGLVMKITDEGGVAQDAGNNPREGYTIEDVQRLYRKNLPVERTPPLEEIIRYDVPYIDHFYYTLRLDRMKVLEPAAGSGFISFEARG